ncbi:MAG: DUF6171 family protein [Clostridium sp.]|jgi:hypothetical protein|nr:DUF6171 family protein [Clostridium sp.]MDY5895090.1 DUF6171 family protein [Oscillospiraceae bacterium]CDC11868.1 putative uncharacterized protein [Clostridium sp. CAG:413]
MSEERVCLRCLLRESGGADTLEDIRKRIEKIHAYDKADDEEYIRRLGICKECEALVSGTCMKCGCYPEFKAAFIRQRCPQKKW